MLLFWKKYCLPITEDKSQSMLRWKTPIRTIESNSQDSPSHTMGLNIVQTLLELYGHFPVEPIPVPSNPLSEGSFPTIHQNFIPFPWDLSMVTTVKGSVSAPPLLLMRKL